MSELIELLMASQMTAYFYHLLLESQQALMSLTVQFPLLVNKKLTNHLKLTCSTIKSYFITNFNIHLSFIDN